MDFTIQKSKWLPAITTGLLVVMLAWSYVTPTLVAAAPSWSEIQLAGNVNKDWQTAAISGNNQVALVGGNRLYVLKNNNSFSEARPAGNTDANWLSTSLSANGQIMLAASDSNIYRTINGGLTWTRLRPAGNITATWQSTAMSSDGHIMVAGIQGGRLYRSTDSGASWTETRPMGDTDQWWMSLSVSSDGSTVLAGAGSAGRLFKSTSGGSNWTETQPAGNIDQDWRITKIGANAQTMLAVARYGRVYLTSNGGSSWTETRPIGNNDAAWMRAGMSGDGQTMVIGLDSGRLYTTSNGGSSWAETQPSGAFNRYWYAIDVSQDGSTMLAGAYSNRVYISGTIGNGVYSGSSDADYDGIASSVEAAAPNAGDANGDGTADNAQSNVASFINPVTGVYATLEVPQSCTITTISAAAESNTHADSSFMYPVGLMDFAALCSVPGSTSTITQYYFGAYDAANAVLRKYDTTTHQYQTIAGAVLSNVTISGQSALKAEYDVTDGGILDVDGVLNGRIVDPAGPAFVGTTTPTLTSQTTDATLTNTGLGIMSIVAMGLFLLLFASTIYYYPSLQRIVTK